MVNDEAAAVDGREGKNQRKENLPWAKMIRNSEFRRGKKSQNIVILLLSSNY